MGSECARLRPGLHEHGLRDRVHLLLASGLTSRITIIYGALDGNATSDTRCSVVYTVWWGISFVPPFTFCCIVVKKGEWGKMSTMLAITFMHPAFFILVPGSLAALGSLISGLTYVDRLAKNNSTFTQRPIVSDVEAGWTMSEIGIAIVVGLSAAVLLIYPMRKKDRGGIFNY